MTPIICIGETAEEFKAQQTFAALDTQLNPIIAMLPANHPIIIAYEPVWAIGTGAIPTLEILENCFSFLKKKLATVACEITLLYGGSVNAKNASSLKQIPFLGGFLVGGASLDFQEFKKIVEC